MSRTPARTLMWEAKAAPGRADDLLAWLLAEVPVGQVFAAGDRVVLVLDLDDAAPSAGAPSAGAPAPPDPPPDPPTELLARPVHAWRFTRVR